MVPKGIMIMALCPGTLFPGNSDSYYDQTFLWLSGFFLFNKEVPKPGSEGV